MLVVLGSGTLLAAQVQTDLDQGVDARLKETELQRQQESPPLKFNEFKLPKDLPLEIPKGAEISPDLSKLTIPEDMDISIPNDLDLSNLDFELPQDFDLQLPEGTVFSPPGLDLPNGGTIKLPDGREFKLPPGSHLDLPPEVVQRLLDQGLPAGTLAKARDMRIAGLPPDLQAQLDPPQFNGGGRMRLPAGTEITLPDGQRFPFAPGILAAAARYLLPAGTTFDIPVEGDAIRSDLPVPRPNDARQVVAKDTGTGARVGVDTEITGLPSRVRKGEPVTVTGYVREFGSGAPIAGAPVDIFMNETKRAPGVLVGQGVSDARGNFRITLDLPTDKPAREYQLVNHAAAFIDANGRRYADGWGDPPFATFASTNITLELPEKDGLGATTAIAGVLVDHTSAPVVGVPVAVSVDGVVVARPNTNAQGRYLLSYSFTAGRHNVEARFVGTSSYEASNVATGSILIEDFAIEIAPVLRGAPGDTITFSGRVLGKGAAAPERTVTLTGLFGTPTIRMLSDSTGSFSYSFTTSTNQAPGAYILTYALPDHNVVKRQTLELTLAGRLSLNTPTLWDVEEPLPVGVSLVTAAGARPISGQPIRLTLAGPGGTSDANLVTDASGSAAVMMHALRAAPGTYTLTARLANPNAYFDAPAVSSSVTMGRFEVEWTLPQSVVRGEDAAGTATLRFADRALANTAITLDFFGLRQLTTDAQGRATWTSVIPTSAALGTATITLQALDHPLRSTTTQVVAVPKLDIDAPESYRIGRPVDASILLTDDLGEPIRNSRVTLAVKGLGTGEVKTVTTDASGRWQGALNTTRDGGNLTLSARFDPTGPYLAADKTEIMSATTTLVSAKTLPWILPLVGLALAGGAGATWYAIKKRPRKPTAPDPAAGAAPVLLARHAPDFDARPAIPEDEPQVWGVGEPLAFRMHNRGREGAFDLSWNGGSERLRLDAGAETAATLRFDNEGDATIVARRDGAPDMDPAETRLRIVDYRKETAREFDLFLDRAQGVDATLTRKSTPREIVWTLEGRLGPDARPHLDEVALVMEVTNYSHYDVKREHYLRFVRASRALDPFFTPPAPEPGA